VLKQAGYNTYFTGKWHLGEADYSLPNAPGYDVMKYVGLYHLNAYLCRSGLVPADAPRSARPRRAGELGVIVRGEWPVFSHRL
jgi:arylsulfatase